MKKGLLFLLFVLFSSMSYAQYIEEIDYDQPSTDNAEFIDVFLPSGASASDYEIVLYNGSDKMVYLTIALTASSVSSSPVTGGMIYTWDPSGSNNIQNGAPDGLALYNTATSTIVQFWSYEGVFTAQDGPANGMTSTNTGVSENNNSPNQSMQYTPEDGWVVSTPNQGVLPIVLTTFTATKKAQTTHLQWQTATEINNDYMAIERSSNGRDFEEITRVKGAGTTYEAQSYEYTDAAPLAGINYYRLRQVDFDGKATLHNTVSVTFDKGEGVVRIIPTEAASEVMVYLPEQVRQTAQLRVYDLTGQLWMNQTLNRGTQERQLDVSALPQGHYFLQLIDGNAVETVRFNKI